MSNKSERPRTIAASAVLLMTAGTAMLMMAVLAVSNGELGITNANIRAVVLVDTLVKVVFGVAFIVLAKLAPRQPGGATLSTWVLGALGTPYLVGIVVLHIPGFSLQLTLPRDNVLNSGNFEIAVQALRAPWHEPVEIALAVIGLAGLLAAMAALVPTIIGQPVAEK